MRAALLMPLLVAGVLAAAPRGKDLHLTFTSAIDGTQQPYRLYVPSSYNGQRAFPLVLVLHGTNRNQNTLFDDAPFASFDLRGAAEKRNVLLLSAHGRGTLEYRGMGETDVFEAIADVSKRYKVDANRVYFTGFSMGATGSAYLAMRHPDIPAAIAAFSPAFSYPWMIDNMARVPSYWLMGANDEKVYRVGVDPGIERLNGVGAEVRFFLLPGRGHEGTLEMFDSVLEWLLTFTRDPHPSFYRYFVDTPLHGRAWWTNVERLYVPGQAAYVDARSLDRRRVNFTLVNVSQMTFVPDPAVFDANLPMLVTVNGRQLFGGTIPPGKQLRIFPTMARVVDAKPEPVAAWRRHPVATAPEALAIAGDESPLGNWISDAMRAATGADIAIYNRRHYRGLPIPQGTVDIADLVQCSLPFDQFLVTTEMSGAVLHELLDANTVDSERLVQISGAQYSFDASKPAGRRIAASTLERERIYTVVFEGQVPERETVLLAGHMAHQQWHNTRVPLSMALYGHAAKSKVIRSAVEGRVKRVR